MTTKIITYNQLRDAIRIAFMDDKFIKDFYDKTVPIESIEDIVNDISEKIKCFGDKAVIKGVFEKDKLIGYYVYLDNIKMLSSFSINNQYRVRGKLREFFALIRKDLGKEWGCLLFTINSRAIRWLLKNGAKVIDRNKFITTLRFEK